MNPTFKWMIISFCSVIIIGLIWANVEYFAKEDKNNEYVSTSISLSWNGISSGKAPNGLNFDFLKIDNVDILQNAINECNVSVSLDDLRKSLLINGVYSEGVIEELMGTDSIVNSASVVVKNSNFVPSSYSIVLYPTECGLSISDAEKVVKMIAEGYKKYITKNYSLDWCEEVISDVLDIYAADYIDALTILQYRLQVIAGTANRYQQINPNFLSDGHYFSDIAVAANKLISNDVAVSMSKCNVNMLSKDEYDLEQRYKYIIRDKKLELVENEKVLNSVNDMINNFHRDSSVYIANGTGLSFVEGNSNKTYENLVAKKVACVEKKSRLQAEIDYYQGRVEVISSANINSETYKNECEIVSEEILSIYQKEQALEVALKKYIKDFNSLSMGDSAISLGRVNIVRPKVLSFGFVKELIKCCGPLVTLVVIFWLGFGVICQIKKVDAGM